jgi:hypothetical protein
MIERSPQRYRDQPPGSRYRPSVITFIPGHHQLELAAPISRSEIAISSI